MASEYQILSAFKTWRDIARTKFNEDQLPTDEELLATAKDPDQLKPGGDYPALLVWATALRRVLGYVQVGTLHVIEQGTDAAMFTPDLDFDKHFEPEDASVDALEDTPVDAESYDDEPADYHYAEVIDEPEYEPELESEPVHAVPGLAQVHEQVVAPEPALEPEPEQELTPEFTPEPEPAPAPEPVAEPAPEPAAEPAPELVRKPAHQAEPSVAEITETPETPEPDPTPAPRRRRQNTGSHRSASAEAQSIDRDIRNWQDYEFARLDGFAEVKQAHGGFLRITANLTGGLDLEWDAPESYINASRVFRIVSDEMAFEQDPDLAEHRVSTVGTHWVDQEPLTTAYRMYQVWMYEGVTESSAVNSQPQLVGESVFINPVSNIELSVAGSEVKGQWAPAEHTHRVAVYAAPSNERLVTASRNEIAADKNNFQGFRFHPQHRGREYKFVARRFAEIHGKLVGSAPSEEFVIDVPAEVVEVPISIEERFDGFSTSFDVTWDAPHSGEVWIYRTQEAPESDLQFNAIETDQLESFGLARRDWANDLEDTKTSCNVVWPEDWYSIFLTPVNVVGNQAQVGQTYSRVRVGEISRPKLYERVNNQLLTFGWPEEAHEVTAVFGEPGSGHSVGPTADTPGSSLVSIHREAYEEEGGMRVKLPGAGDVALFASRVYEGRQIWGQPEILKYRGLDKFSYKLHLMNNRLFLSIYSERPNNQFNQFSLRIHPSRLPLEPEDGQEVMTRKIINDGGGQQYADLLAGISFSSLRSEQEPEVEYWEIDPKIASLPPTSYLRLFIHQEESDDVHVKALIDPAPSLLNLGTWIGGSR
ncbi:hypothetical protein J433_07245 [Corynebacterium glutamicum MT]|uniref:hypothetical protein n=1 Tax=Corynebacterium glutamicum TaxID=1718 RepID=UPI00032710B1|nr:hypothetical protein [Corynebacterium glutamicum]EOA64557.1 hypothetical protein J433_07245 [Corynebacterium glutamicum MT]